MLKLTEEQIEQLVADANDPEGVLAAIEELAEKKIIAPLRAAMAGEWEGRRSASMRVIQEVCLKGDMTLAEFLEHEANLNAYIGAVQNTYMVIGLIMGWRKLGSLLPFDEEEVKSETE